MSKFILVGGYPANATDKGKAFAKEVVEGFDQPVRILMCAFARPKETWEEVLEKDKLFFATMLRPLKTILTLATPEQFLKECKQTDVIYFKGGDTEVLKDVLSCIPGWEATLAHKTVVGTSAGAELLSAMYYDIDRCMLATGSGVLPIKVLTHYRSDYNAPNVDWNKAYRELDRIEDETELYALKEGEFSVIEHA